ncbi:uncharacterized protein UTRI_10438_B [Ustilago trichophora]|uniref:Uncharacterized protein n=1 Tax=Ustilago trichophora TaxID=86804 RepID=A0A5C3E8B3_9BASI|nr:uncharacterized protein UTRI_10438_B [Ustilago trichophora]
MTVLRQLLFLAFGLIILAFGVSGSNWENAEPPSAERVDASRRAQEALDEDMAMHAYSKYASVHRKQNAVFQPYFTHLSEYRHISDLEAEALRLGQQKGILYIGRTRAGKSGPQTLFFSTLFRPTDPLGRKMNLEDKIALAFWRRDPQGTKLLDIDAMVDHELHWPLRSYSRLIKLR